MSGYLCLPGMISIPSLLNSMNMFSNFFSVIEQSSALLSNHSWTLILSGKWKLKNKDILPWYVFFFFLIQLKGIFYENIWCFFWLACVCLLQQEEWRRGLKALHSDTISKLKKSLSELEKEVNLLSIKSLPSMAFFLIYVFLVWIFRSKLLEGFFSLRWKLMGQELDIEKTVYLCTFSQEYVNLDGGCWMTL